MSSKDNQMACPYTPKPTMDASAQCLCGGLQWTARFDRGNIPGQVLCHCMPCKTFGGGEYTVNMMIPKNNIKVTKGEPKVYTYTGRSGNPVDCYYCPTCTTHIYHHERVLGDRYTVHSLLFDDDEIKTRPIEMELFGKDRMPYQPEIAKTYSETDDS